MAFGVSFLPSDRPEDQGAERAPADRFQEAIKILSLRLPRVLGGSAVAPAPLLQAQGGRGSPFARSGLAQTQQVAPGLAAGNDPVLMALLQMAGLGRSAPSQRMPATQRSAAAPRIVPGVTGGLPQPGGYQGYQPGDVDLGPSAPNWTPPPMYPNPTPYTPPLYAREKTDWFPA